MIYKWIATISFLIAAVLLSSNIDESRIGFVIFLYGHTILAFRSEERRVGKECRSRGLQGH